MKTLIEIADEILAKDEARRQPIASRYPYTYADDFVRAHAADFGLDSNISRSDASQFITQSCGGNEDDARETFFALANAYLTEEGFNTSAQTLSDLRAAHDAEVQRRLDEYEDRKRARLADA